VLPQILSSLVKAGLLIGGLMTAAAYLVLLERWIAAWVQDRLGPNRVGLPLTNLRLFGLGQPMADGVKFMFKSDATPAHVDKFTFFVAPATILVAALTTFAVIPFGSVLPQGLFPESWGLEDPLQLIVAPGLDVGMLFVFAVSSIAVYGVVLGGWASNNKYSFLGGMRSSAQLISYELPLGLAILSVVLAAGSLRLDTIIAQQANAGAWNVMLQPLGFVVFCVAAFAEAARLPFDLPEAEQELVGGYHTEYAGIKLLMYLVAEFLHMVLAAMLIVVLFLGGWHFWGLTDGIDGPGGQLVTWPVALLRIGVFVAKILGVILFFMLARWSWPRFRYDQLMNVGWKVMLPWGMINVAAVAVVIEYGRQLGQRLGLSEVAFAAAFGWAALALTWLVTTLLDPTTTDNRPRQGLPVAESDEVAV
jgi:NADH-quinone oxidoreductase subunit H